MRSRESSLDSRLGPLRNAWSAMVHPLSVSDLLELLSLALQTDVLDAATTGWLTGLSLQDDARRALEAFVACPQPSLEVTWRQRGEPLFENRLRSVCQVVRPGDLVFWGSQELGWPWNFMRSVYGRWMHVSLALSEESWLDPYWPEGVIIVRPEDALAKAARRIRATEIAVVRPVQNLTEGDLLRLNIAARALCGMPYGLMGAPEVVVSAVSCSRAVWETYRAVGINLLEGRRRLFTNSIAPCDIFQGPQCLVHSDGTVSSDVPVGEPFGKAGGVVRGAENLLSTLPWGSSLLCATGPIWTVGFMRMMHPSALDAACPSLFV
ncbi:MAG: hypothetical protein VKN33_03810 [Candidatus Sericytochromatia bacterium]|nr:hypothetical protein [Candidatus Sericytochromatia bacterium]